MVLSRFRKAGACWTAGAALLPERAADHRWFCAFMCLHSRQFRYVWIFNCWQLVLDRGWAMINTQPKAHNSLKPLMRSRANCIVLFWQLVTYFAKVYFDTPMCPFGQGGSWWENHKATAATFVNAAKFSGLNRCCIIQSWTALCWGYSKCLSVSQ